MDALIQNKLFDRLAIYITVFTPATGYVEMDIPAGLIIERDLVLAYFEDDACICAERTVYGIKTTFKGTFKDHKLACYCWSKRFPF